MNLHAIASPIIAAVNPMTAVTLRRSTGYTINADKSRVATYSDAALQAQIQALTYQDLQMIEGLQLNGERRSIYLYGNYGSMNRGAGTGGDLVIFPDATVWVIAFTFETWPGWCRVAATLQVS